MITVSFSLNVYAYILFAFSDAQCQVVVVVQKDPLITAELGANLAILRNYSSDFMHKVSWYKQTIGTRQLLVADSQRYSKEATFYNGFDKNHYIVQTEDSSCDLSIVKTEQSDSATYYCAVAFMNIITFGDGTVLLRIKTYFVCSCKWIYIYSKSWVDKTIPEALNSRTAVYNTGIISGNMDKYKSAAYGVRRAVREAKRCYRKKLETLNQGN
uniref:Immunoglobulin V-set domain-containing protein n=1 Tax=Electrophorus electricus TaxID=8005 RepID=A0A4W4DNV2_ELEEL